ncbi:hypothetical protein [Sphingomonas sp. IW22]|uniref:hypothetical protein n=1 Tax=Sphingomonas sp. IW22 TaxID=3242489 RepID=UPI003522367D
MMGIPREKLQAAVDAGHPDTALIGVPVSLMREILRVLPVATLPVPTPVVMGLDVARGNDLHG